MADIRIPQEAMEGNALFEGYHKKLANGWVKPYLCPANVPTIGFGSTSHPNGRKLRMGDAPISRSTAEAYMRNDLQIAARGVKRDTQVDLTDEQFSALLMFANNVGTGAYKNSTLRYFVNKRNWPAASREFLKWVNGGGRRLSGLVRRRQYESQLFLRGSGKAAVKPLHPTAVTVTLPPPPATTRRPWWAFLWPWAS